MAISWLRQFFGGPEVDLRAVQQALHRLGLMLAVSGGNPGYVMFTASLAVILLARDPALMDRLLNEEQSEGEVANEVFSWVDPAFRNSNDGCNLEGVIVAAAVERQSERNRVLGNRQRPIQRHIENIVVGMGAAVSDEDRGPAVQAVVAFAEHLLDWQEGIPWVGFREAVQMMELISADGRERPD